MYSVKVLLLISFIVPSQSEMHSLYYMYSVISKSQMSGEVFEFYTSVELNDIQMSLCHSVNKADFMTQLCEESERLFNESDDLHYKQQWLQINLKTLMKRKNSTRDTVGDLHVLQWRHGCAVERHSNGSVMFLQGTDEYAYDGQILTFDLSNQWKPLVLDHDIIWNRESVSSLERKCVKTLTSFIDLQLEGKFIMKCPKTAFGFIPTLDSERSPLWARDAVIGSVVCILIIFPMIVLTFYQLRKYGKHPKEQDTLKTPSLQLSALHKTQMKPELLEESRAERCADLTDALNDSDDENTTDPRMEEEHTEEVHDTQSLCDTEATPAAARGAMGSKIISLPNFAMEREDTDQNTFTQNALLLPPPRRCRSKDISLPNLI
ncbi:uncharacterized protein LOC125275913 [Megalobrama amblycephala]|uniref:uncharacterized protein LOC125275893 n=1 Tax=Megalobrama amblycephala TaxID=75352 RepID=UPI0020142F19|nr:uncharacterized protein LOC125275893 [Megalobrama amblycephala]XP_048059158.1 uncharacterized protein LOC125275893 [Megalobrama amblycephala]XP_048059159.1 uncharacterized protein LOC125275893 [Megalobrama amblycephala]XP_048059197.1 uncharacterized protein LOC125275913 [Megalobrama amblycephala]XP_048059198.1 uncharacterized protein LOC125275913 [Megalobrama amblycephala]XP_048059200.1 uncharacterized protein LOC125275913 [Megalobrama amblycephala]